LTASLAESVFFLFSFAPILAENCISAESKSNFYGYCHLFLFKTTENDWQFLFLFQSISGRKQSSIFDTVFVFGLKRKTCFQSDSNYSTIKTNTNLPFVIWQAIG